MSTHTSTSSTSSASSHTLHTPHQPARMGTSAVSAYPDKRSEAHGSRAINCCHRCGATAYKTLRLFMRSGVLRQENRKQGVQGCLAASSDVVQALKEGQVEGEFFLGNPPVWAQPGAQQ